MFCQLDGRNTDTCLITPDFRVREAIGFLVLESS